MAIKLQLRTAELQPVVPMRMAAIGVGRRVAEAWAIEAGVVALVGAKVTLAEVHVVS